MFESISYLKMTRDMYNTFYLIMVSNAYTTNYMQNLVMARLDASASQNYITSLDSCSIFVN